MKIVINTRFGSFGLSRKALELYSVLKYGDNFVEESPYYMYIHIQADDVIVYDDCIERDDPLLVQVVEELGEQSWGKFSKLVIKEIPDGSEWTIEEHDGFESVRKPCTYY